MSTPKSVVVGVDGSETSIDALRWALMPNGIGALVRPVLTWDYPAALFLPAGVGGVPAAPAELMQDAAEKAMETVLSEFGSHERLGSPIVRKGSPEAVLLSLSESAEMVVVGSRGLGAVKRTLLGSTSRHLVSHVAVPIAIVPDIATPVNDAPRRIVVGVDDSDHAAHALAWALAWARDEDEISAVCAWQIPKGLGYDIPQFDREPLRAGALQTVHDVVTKAGGDGRVIAKIAEGDPRSVLLHLGREAELIVVGARGRSGLVHFALGSTTSSLIGRLPIPMVVVP
jgi:nucleotide-binding universal stress UspA family protein